MDTANINLRAVRNALPGESAASARLRAENARLATRVRELEEQLRRERSRADGLSRGVSALSDTVSTLRRKTG